MNQANRWMLVGQFLSSLGGVIMGTVVVIFLVAFLIALAIPDKPSPTDRCIDAAQTTAAIDRCMEKGGYR